jgi:hypothetical protein
VSTSPWSPREANGVFPVWGRQFASTRPTVLMFHGNGGNHGHRIPLAKIFFGKMRCNVLMLSYRGYVPALHSSTRCCSSCPPLPVRSYGHSEGTPSEKGTWTTIVACDPRTSYVNDRDA